MTDRELLIQEVRAFIERKKSKKSAAELKPDVSKSDVGFKASDIK